MSAQEALAADFLRLTPQERINQVAEVLKFIGLNFVKKSSCAVCCKPHQTAEPSAVCMGLGGHIPVRGYADLQHVSFAPEQS